MPGGEKAKHSTSPKILRFSLTGAFLPLRHHGRMRLLFVMLTLLAFTIWDQSANHGQFSGPFFQLLRRLVT
jgi:hypothetical protein